MDPEQAWQSALGQLQMDMPKASFDTWVRDTRPVSYDNGAFTIGVRNTYARDWLDSRLSSTVTRLLTGIMDRNVDVQFVVINRDDEIAESIATEEEPEAKTEVPQDDLVVEARYDLVYDEIVVPDRVTVVPGYFRKHLRVIGPDLGWLYMGFRQAAFNAGARSGTKRERFSGKAIATLSGIAERTFWNRIGKTDTWEHLKGLVTTTQAAPEWDTSSVTPRRLPRRYIVAMTLPLTAADTRSLRAWLTANLEGMGGPEKVIEAAAEAPLNELLPLNAQVREGDAPETVTTLLRSLFGETLPPERLAALSTCLHKHIMPDADRLGVTHFFVEHVLPHLGAGPGWMLTMLRDRCWVNRETGEVRNQVRVPGGYAEIGGWLGVTPQTIWRWLYGRHSASRGRSKSGAKSGEQRGPGRQASEAGKLSFPVLSIYVRETTAGKAASFSASPRIFDVLLDEIPAEIIEAALDNQADQALTRALDDQANSSALDSSTSRAVCSIGFARFAVSESPILARFAVSQDQIPARFADDNRAVCSIVTARYADHLRAVCRVFKSLNLLNRITNDLNQPASSTRESFESTESRNKPGGREEIYLSSGGDWDLEKLFKTLDIHPKTQAKFRAANIPPWALVAWLLQSLTMRGVNTPIHFAISKVANQETRYAAEQNFVVLAKRPAALLHEIKAVLHFGLQSGELGATYRLALGNDKAVATTLWRLLTSEDGCEGVSVERTSTCSEQVWS